MAENKDPKDLRIVKVFGYIFLGILSLILIVFGVQSFLDWWDRPPPNLTNCPIFYTSSQHGDINLPVGTIFGYPAKSGENLYDIIRDDTFIMSAYFIESFKKDFRCFKTEEEAVNAGYKKFLSNQKARKEARIEAQKHLYEIQQGSNATDTSKTLRAIDAVLGL